MPTHSKASPYPAINTIKFYRRDKHLPQVNPKMLSKREKNDGPAGAKGSSRSPASSGSPGSKGNEPGLAGLAGFAGLGAFGDGFTGIATVVQRRKR